MCNGYLTARDFSNEIFPKIWSGVVLFKGVDPIGSPRHKVMLTEFHGSVAERGGTVELTPTDYEHAPKTKRRRSVWLRRLLTKFLIYDFIELQMLLLLNVRH